LFTSIEEYLIHSFNSTTCDGSIEIIHAWMSGIASYRMAAEYRNLLSRGIWSRPCNTSNLRKAYVTRDNSGLDTLAISVQ